jgi:hypothetical protein
VVGPRDLPDQRSHIAWNLSSFFVGEERVTTQFSGLVRAYESQSEEAFLVIEGTLALTGQYFITEYLESHDLLPGFTEGFKKIATDEHRHVAYGTWYLQQAARDPGLRRRIADKLVELIPVATGVLVPPGADPEHFEILGYSSEETNAFAFRALSRRLNVVGVDLGAGVVA